VCLCWWNRVCVFMLLELCVCVYVVGTVCVCLCCWNCVCVYVGGTVCVFMLLELCVCLCCWNCVCVYVVGKWHVVDNQPNRSLCRLVQHPDDGSYGHRLPAYHVTVCCTGVHAMSNITIQQHRTAVSPSTSLYPVSITPPTFCPHVFIYHWNRTVWAIDRVIK
jgi:hypothetical protein